MKKFVKYFWREKKKGNAFICSLCPYKDLKVHNYSSVRMDLKIFRFYAGRENICVFISLVFWLVYQYYICVTVLKPLVWSDYVSACDRQSDDTEHLNIWESFRLDNLSKKMCVSVDKFRWSLISGVYTIRLWQERMGASLTIGDTYAL